MIKKFKDISNYIYLNPDMDSPESKMIWESPTYGKYTITNLLTVDLISACDDMVLSEVHDLYTKIRENLGMVRIERTDSKKYNNNQTLTKFNIWTPLVGDNDDWVDPKNYLKKFPLSVSKTKIINLLK